MIGDDGVAPQVDHAEAWRPAMLAGLVTLTATVAVVLLVARGDDHDAGIALARAVIAGVPVGVGVYAWRSRHPTAGALLALLGAGSLVAALAEADHAVPYDAGRVAGWLVELLIVYVCLAYPGARLRTTTDRVLFAVAVLVFAVLYVPQVLLADGFPVPSPYTSCVHDCPGNAWMLPSTEPAFVADVLRPFAGVAASLTMLAFAARLWQRRRSEPPVTVCAVEPVLLVGMVHGLLAAVLLWTREAGGTAQVVQLAAGVLAIITPVLALAVVVGLARERAIGTDASQQVLRRLGGGLDVAALRGALATVLRDPGIIVAVPNNGTWVDAYGDDVRIPDVRRGRSTTLLRTRGAVIGALVHDGALDRHPDVLTPVRDVAAVALTDEQLTAEVARAVADVRESRARIAVSADEERRRIERDLHDGAQQRLVALRIQLELVIETVETDPHEGAERLQRLSGEVDAALAEIRALARGIYPPLLAETGLTGALQAAALRSTAPVELHADGVVRHPPEVESAVYFCVLEALQNIAKHAPGAARVEVDLYERDGRLCFRVHDDDAGAPDGALPPGAGITNMRDRLSAIGGGIDARGILGDGTSVEGWVPVGARIIRSG